MVQSNHFSSEFARVPSDQLDGALPCVPGVHGVFDLTAEARYDKRVFQTFLFIDTGFFEVK